MLKICGSNWVVDSHRAAKASSTSISVTCLESSTSETLSGKTFRSRMTARLFPHLTEEQVLRFIPNTCAEIEYVFEVVENH